MKPKWLLQSDVFDENLNLLVDEIKNQGMEVKVVEYKHFDWMFGSALEFEYHRDDCVIVYGSLQMCETLRRDAEWVPGVYCDIGKYKCSSYYPHFGDYLLNNDYLMIPFEDLARKKDQIFDIVGNNGCVFVRPDSGAKDFTGGISTYDNWEDDIQRFRMSAGVVEEHIDSLVVVASPVNIDREWRFIVVDGEIRTGSQYRDRAGSRLIANYPYNVYDYAQSVIESVNYNPERVWCIDICESNYGLHVLEIGCFSAAGLYLAEKEIIVRDVSLAALDEWKDIYEV